MKGVLKCGLFALLFVASSIVSSISFSDSAYASVAQPAPLCENYPAFNNLLEADERYDAEKTGWIAFRVGGYGGNILNVIWDKTSISDEPAEQWRIFGFDTSGEDWGFTGYNFDSYEVGNAPGFPPTLNYQWSNGEWTGGSDFNISCIEQVKNVDYSEPYLNAGGVRYDDRDRGEPSPPVEHKPNITWSVNDKDAIVYSDSAKNTATLPTDYQIYWWISNVTTDGVQPDEAFALSGCTPPDYNNNFTVPVYFDYGVQAYYADKDCNILHVDDEDNRLTDNMVVLTIDGSTFDGSTTDHEAIIGEIEDNAILKAIRQFRPNDGGLAGLIYAPIEAIATLPTIVGSCSPINLPLLGEQVSLTCIRPTIQASPMGAVYNTISVIITGMVTWWVAWKTFGTIKSIQDPQDDRVEVLKL